MPNSTRTTTAQGVQSYSYRPEPIFYGSDRARKFRMGFELEITGAGCRNDVANYITGELPFTYCNCHPYPVSANEKHLTAHRIAACVGVAHNGVIRLTASAGNTRMNDTQLFVRDFLSAIDGHAPLWYKSKAMLDMVELMMSSKLAILDGDGHIATIGHFIQSGGLLFSNDSYMPRPAYFDFPAKYSGYPPAKHRAVKPAAKKK